MESHLFYLAFLTVCVLSICNCTAEDAEDHYGARLRREATLEPSSDSAIQSRPKLRITTIVDEPFFLVVDENNIGNSRYEGYIVDLTGQLANKLSFDYEFSLVKDGQYGSLSRDGNWSGMVGELINGEADMVAAGLTISSLRAAVVDFSHPFMHYGIQVLMKKPPDGLIIENSLFEFLSPFEARVWICIFVAFVVVALVLFLLSRFSPYEWRALSTLP
ncbi:putative glutamate receptor [Glandiceps talaboti]